MLLLILLAVKVNPYHGEFDNADVSEICQCHAPLIECQIQTDRSTLTKILQFTIVNYSLL